MGPLWAAQPSPRFQEVPPPPGHPHPVCQSAVTGSEVLRCHPRLGSSRPTPPRLPHLHTCLVEPFQLKVTPRCVTLRVSLSRPTESAVTVVQHVIHTLSPGVPRYSVYTCHLGELCPQAAAVTSGLLLGGPTEPVNSRTPSPPPQGTAGEAEARARPAGRGPPAGSLAGALLPLTPAFAFQTLTGPPTPLGCSSA